MYSISTGFHRTGKGLVRFDKPAQGGTMGLGSEGFNREGRAEWEETGKVGRLGPKGWIQQQWHLLNPNSFPGPNPFARISTDSMALVHIQVDPLQLLRLTLGQGDICSQAPRKSPATKNPPWMQHSPWRCCCFTV